MSIASEISRLQSAKASIKTSIQGKGVTVPSSATLDDFSDYIDAISTGGATLITKTITANGTYSATSDNADGYSQVTVSVPTSGLTYETGTYSPTSDIAKLTVSFSKTHQYLPFFIAFVRTDTSTPAASRNVSFIYYDATNMVASSGYMHSTNHRYGYVYFQFVGTNGTASSANLQFSHPSSDTGTSSTAYPRYWVTTSNFKAYTNSSSRYWTGGETFKWIAVWAPNQS